MNITSIMYHDVVDAGAYDVSGFEGADAALYKVDSEQFKMHLSAIAAAVEDQPISVLELLTKRREGTPLLVTFDDGGVSAHTHVTEILDGLRWPGHFFVTAGYIDKPGFLTKQQIQDIHRRGHIIGSHSLSHPERMSYCSQEEISREWRQSLDLLSDITGSKTRIASVPGGFYSRKVAEKAAEEGVEVLFTSEPTTRSHVVDGCLVLGRYTVQRWMSPAVVAALANGHGFARSKQVILWNVKKASKMLGGTRYSRLRKLLTQKSLGRDA
jgi:peptidoglycan/xylan/chitin deacetylase (PgdA/CDA1 family)